MPRVTCRCGQVLSVPVNGPDRVVCPTCSAKIRVRREAPAAGGDDGFIRFFCPCGRRLKVRAAATDGAEQFGKCPDCGSVVPVPARSTSPASSGTVRARPNDPESPTAELSASDIAALDRWARGHTGEPDPVSAAAPEPPGGGAGEADPAPGPAAPAPASESPAASTVKAEAGLRVCPRCGQPLHLSAVTCRGCGAPAPRR